MAAARYKKLPGHRRGLFRGSSVWLGEGHLLSVRNLRIREEYKRFHLRDIQSIAVGSAPRFHVSTRMLGVIALWLIANPIIGARLPRFMAMWWILGAAILLAWVVVSGWFSCRCRIYTAVSREELPSVYRVWTARRFLARVTPLIEAVQGTVDANWVEAAEQQSSAPDGATPVSAGTGAAPGSGTRAYTWAAWVFIATLLIAGLLDLALVRQSAGWVTQVQVMLICVLLVESVLLFVQNYRGLLPAGMRNVAIANLSAIGVMYYVRQMTFSFMLGAQKSLQREVKVPLFYSGAPWMRTVEAAVWIILGLIGLGLALRSKGAQAPPETNL